MSKSKITLKKLKELDTIWHPESTVVFRSAKEKVAIGRYVDGEMISLDDDALEACIKWGFKYDNSLLEKDEEEVEEVEDDGEEEDTEETPIEETNEEENVDSEEIETEKHVEVISDNSSNLYDLTNEYSLKLSEFFSKVQREYAEKITNYENDLVALHKKLNLEVENHKETQQNLDKMNKKFEAFKAMFN